MKESEEERLNRIRKQLNKIHSWPSIFTFKFVVPSDPEKITQLHEIFGESAEYRERLSRKGNYTSVTVREMMLNADQIFDRYNAASKIDGIIAL